MKLPDGSVLMHAEHAPYDPVKAHEYYLRTRQLKGRKKGRTITVTNPDGTVAQLTPQQLQEQKAYAAHRVQEIKAKLADLNSKLKKKLAEARKAEAEAKKKPTAADKHKQAKESKKYRDKHKTELANKRKKADDKNKTPDKKSAPNTVDELKTAIAEVKGRLDAALEKQRSLTAAKSG